MKKNHLAIMCLFIFIAMLISSQAFPQVLKRERLVKKPWVKSQDLLFIQGNMYLNSALSEMNVHFVLKNIDMNGEFIRGATVTVNGTEIRESNDPGNYHGVAKVYQQQNGFPVDVKIVTTDAREVASSGKFESLLNLDISNIFPRQPDKIEVGEPVTIRWNFNPGPQRPVDLFIVNMNNNTMIFQRRNTMESQVVIPQGGIPAQEKITISVEVPPVQFPIQQNVHGSSFIKLHIKTWRTLFTFG